MPRRAQGESRYNSISLTIQLFSSSATNAQKRLVVDDLACPEVGERGTFDGVDERVVDCQAYATSSRIRRARRITPSLF